MSHDQITAAIWLGFIGLLAIADAISKIGKRR